MNLNERNERFDHKTPLHTMSLLAVCNMTTENLPAEQSADLFRQCMRELIEQSRASSTSRPSHRRRSEKRILNELTALRNEVARLSTTVIGLCELLTHNRPPLMSTTMSASASDCTAVPVRSLALPPQNNAQEDSCNRYEVRELPTPCNALHLESEDPQTDP